MAYGTFERLLHRAQTNSSFRHSIILTHGAVSGCQQSGATLMVGSFNQPSLAGGEIQLLRH